VTARGLWWRLGGALVLTVGLYIAFSVLRFEPHALPLALLVLLSVVAVGLVVDGLGVDDQSWAVDMARWATPPGQDPRFSLYLRTIESHLTAQSPEPALRDRLAELAGRRLEQRHGVRRDDPRAAELLGPDLTAVLDGPPRRLSRAEIDRCVRRIEEL
jgi:hypothetical protein